MGFDHVLGFSPSKIGESGYRAFKTVMIIRGHTVFNTHEDKDQITDLVFVGFMLDCQSMCDGWAPAGLH